MKTMIKMMMTTLALMTTPLVRAESNWAAINTAGYADKTGLKNVTAYSAYYCTVVEAESMFGSSGVDTLTSYFKSNFAAGETLLKGGATTLSEASWSEVAQYYTFFTDFTSAPTPVNYLAVVLYGSGESGERAFRVFGAANGELDAGHLVFDDEVTTGLGAWTTVASVPEPTSGLLLLLGFAGLALKRKRA